MQGAQLTVGDDRDAPPGAGGDEAGRCGWVWVRQCRLGCRKPELGAEPLQVPRLIAEVVGDGIGEPGYGATAEQDRKRSVRGVEMLTEQSGHQEADGVEIRRLQGCQEPVEGTAGHQRAVDHEQLARYLRRKVWRGGPSAQHAADGVAEPGEAPRGQPCLRVDGAPAGRGRSSCSGRF